MAPMKKTVQGPRPRIRRSTQRHSGHKPQSPRDLEQRDDELPLNDYGSKFLERGDDDHGNGSNGGCDEYPMRYPSKYSVSWAPSCFEMDRRRGTRDGDSDHAGGVVVEDLPPPGFSQKRRYQTHVNNKSWVHKPYLGKKRYQKNDDHRCPPKVWENRRGTQYHHRSSNTWFRNDHESRSPNFLRESQISPNVHGGVSSKRGVVKPSSSSLRGELPKELYRSSFTEFNMETSIPPTTPPLENVDSRKNLATPLRGDHGKTEDEIKKAIRGGSDHATTTLDKLGVVHGDQTKGKKEKDDVPEGTSNHARSLMEDTDADCPSKKGASPCYFNLLKDNKMICRTKCWNPPIQPPYSWNIDIVKKISMRGLANLPQFSISPAFEDSHQKFEWTKFLTYLHESNKIAAVQFEGLKICILPPEGTKPSKTVNGLFFHHAVVAYEVQEAQDTTADQNHAMPVVNAVAKTMIKSEQKRRSGHENKHQGLSHPHLITPDACVKGQMVISVTEATHSTRMLDIPAVESDAHVKGSNSAEKVACSSISKYPEAVNSHPCFAASNNYSLESNFVRADPSYLKTLGQAHSGWIFGAIAELIDNSRDANASRLDIGIENIYDKRADCEIPMLFVTDDGDGMNYEQILRMISFGHKQPDEDNQDRIGRFGVGFKTGAMRLGRDALVFTQTTKSRSIAFLSQSLNEGKDNVEIPIVSYRRLSQGMEFDTTVQSEVLAVQNLRAIKKFSPFNEYLIGEKSALFKSSTGTQIYIWNLDKWGSDYSLEWREVMSRRSSFHHGDIFIRSRRVRSRPGQTSRKVPLDYSLRSYLEVMFLEPRMKIYVQGSPVQSRPLAKSLNNTAVENGEIMGIPVRLTLGRCQLEWDQANCGVFLYWHGRLIEGYKRVGGMIHSPDIGRGVIGVIDVTELMDDGNGGVWVHSNKQGFQDCEIYARLEEWLGSKVDEYWDTHFDALRLTKGNGKPDQEWVQCEKCRKWRVLNAGFDSSTLIGEWFCYMEPFNGRCEMPEQKVGRGIITIGTKRRGYSGGASECKDGLQTNNGGDQGKPEDCLNEIEDANAEVERPVLKRLRRGNSKVSAKK